MQDAEICPATQQNPQPICGSELIYLQLIIAAQLQLLQADSAVVPEGLHHIGRACSGIDPPLSSQCARRCIGTDWLPYATTVIASSVVMAFRVGVGPCLGG